MSSKTIVRLPEVMARTGLSRSTIYAKIAAHSFPTSINLGPRAVGWISGEIQNWIQARIDASRPDDSQ